MMDDAILDQIYDVIDEADASNGEVLSLIAVMLVNVVLDADSPGGALDDALGSLRRFVADVIAHPAQRGGDYEVGARH